jgi:hypothetical protein
MPIDFLEVPTKEPGLNNLLMKNASATQWLLCTLGLWLLSQQCAQCFYDTSSQRWINRDPLQEPGGVNLFEFAASSPVSNCDPLGLEMPVWEGPLSHPPPEPPPPRPPPFPNPTYPSPTGTDASWNPYTGQWDPPPGLQSEDWILFAGSSAVCPRFLTGAGPIETAESQGLGNPFKGKKPPEIDDMLKRKGFSPRGPDPASGKGGYVNPKTGRSYHIDPNNSFNDPPHVDVNRLKDYNGPLSKKKYPCEK